MTADTDREMALATFLENHAADLDGMDRYFHPTVMASLRDAATRLRVTSVPDDEIAGIRERRARAMHHLAHLHPEDVQDFIAHAPTDIDTLLSALTDALRQRDEWQGKHRELDAWATSIVRERDAALAQVSTLRARIASASEVIRPMAAAYEWAVRNKHETADFLVRDNGEILGHAGVQMPDLRRASSWMENGKNPTPADGEA